MSGRRITQIQYHDQQDTIQVVVHEWPDAGHEMIGPVILGARVSPLQYQVEIMVPAHDERFQDPPFDRVVANAPTFVAQAMMGDPVEQRRREQAGLGGAPGPFWPGAGE